jgi:ribose transport system substrate-binding protein
MKRVLIALLVLAVSTGLFAGGQKDSSAAGGAKGAYKIVFIPKGVADFWTIVSGGFEQGAKEAGLTPSVVYPDEEEASRQVEAMYNVINSKPDAIVLSPISLEALAPVCADAKKAGIPVVLVDTLIATDDYVNAYATNNKNAGALTAQKMAELLGGRGKVHIFAGTPAATSNTERIAGFREYMAQNCPNIQVLGELFSDADIQLAMSQTVDIIQANPDLAGIFAVDEVRSSGCSNALISLNKQNDIVLCGFDANPDTVALMERGVINTMTVQQPFQMGYMGFEAALKSAQGEKLPHEVVDTGCTVVEQAQMNTEANQRILFPLNFIGK